MTTLLSYLKNKRILTVLFLGFSSGLPLALTGSTLQAWLTQSGVSLITIGTLSLVGMPYVWKFLWAPILDRFTPPWLGRRRGWILITQLGLCAALFILSLLSPQKHTAWIGLLALVIAFVSASQDIAIDAYRTDILLPDERGLGTAYYMFAYRMAMLISGGLALILADRLGWRVTYEIMAVLIGLSILASYFGPEIDNSLKAPQTFAAAVIEPIRDLLQRDKILWILLFVIFYKFGDALALSLMSNFLLHGLGFSLTAVGLAYKTGGLAATILGSFVGGILLIRLSLFRSLLLFGLLQAISNFTFMFLAMIGKNYAFMAGSIFIEAFCSGMGTAAFVAFIMSLCNHQYTATEFAFLSALSAIGRVILGPVAAVMVAHLGWTAFYAGSFILSFPGILLLFKLQNGTTLNVFEAS